MHAEASKATVADEGQGVYGVGVDAERAADFTRLAAIPDAPMASSPGGGQTAAVGAPGQGWQGAAGTRVGRQSCHVFVPEADDAVPRLRGQPSPSGAGPLAKARPECAGKEMARLDDLQCPYASDREQNGARRRADCARLEATECGGGGNHPEAKPSLLTTQAPLFLFPLPPPHLPVLSSSPPGPNSAGGAKPIRTSTTLRQRPRNSLGKNEGFRWRRHTD